jgi:hypothetical protein
MVTGVNSHSVSTQTTFAVSANISPRMFPANAVFEFCRSNFVSFNTFKGAQA